MARICVCGDPIPDGMVMCDPCDVETGEELDRISAQLEADEADDALMYTDDPDFDFADDDFDDDFNDDFPMSLEYDDDPFEYDDPFSYRDEY